MPQKEGSLGIIVIFCNIRRLHTLLDAVSSSSFKAPRLWLGSSCQRRSRPPPLRHHTRACSDECRPVLVLVLGRVTGARWSVVLAHLAHRTWGGGKYLDFRSVLKCVCVSVCVRVLVWTFNGMGE